MDPEENSAEFMGILIKVGTQASSAQHVLFYPSYVLYCFYFVLGIWKTLHVFCCHFMLGSCQIEKNPRDHQGHNGEAGTRAETDRQAVHHSDSRPCLSERGELGSGEPAQVQYPVGEGKAGFSILQEDPPLSPEVSLPLVKAVSAR